MTVIVKREPPMKRREVKCRGCHALLGFSMTVEDLTPGYFDSDYTDPGPMGVGVRCPRCTTLTEIKNAPDTLIDKVHETKAKR